MTVRIGINPLTWTNDDLPELGGETPLDVCLAEARQAGYAGMELGHKFPRKTAELRPILEKHGLALISGWYSAELLARSAADEIRAVQDHFNLLADFGCTAMVFAEVTGCVHGQRDVPVVNRPRLRDDQWREFGERMTEVGEHLLTRGVRIAYHHHMGTVVETEEEIDRLMANTGEAVGLLVDTGHLTYAGGDPLAVIRRHGKRIVHVHCKDVRPAVLADAKNRNRSFLDAVLDGVFTVPGDGSIDYRAVLRALKEVGYQGWLVVEAEQDPAVAHPLTYATRGYQHLRQLVDEIGL